MKLSEAIMLGRNLIGLDSFTWYDREANRGCLLGMGMAALGRVEQSGNTEMLERWPWLSQAVRGSENGPFQVDGLSWVSGLARRVENGQISFEQAVDCIRQVEPDEPKPVESLPENQPVTDEVHSTVKSL